MQLFAKAIALRARRAGSFDRLKNSLDRSVSFGAKRVSGTSISNVPCKRIKLLIPLDDGGRPGALPDSKPAWPSYHAICAKSNIYEHLRILLDNIGSLDGL
jgi:hypothetical protein